MSALDRFVLDTSVFTNPDVHGQFDADPIEALRVFLGIAERARAELYMPTSVYEELGRMRDLGPLAADFETVVRIRSPRKAGLSLPGEILYEFIEEVRRRIDKGLRVAEEAARSAAQAPVDADVGRLINHLRERYREALRQGILDSREDADVLLLAYELDGVLVSGDEGLRKWADKVGVRIVGPRHLRRILENLVPGGSEPA